MYVASHTAVTILLVSGGLGGCLFILVYESKVWVSHIPRVFCKLLTTAFQLPTCLTGYCHLFSSPHSSSDFLPEGLGAYHVMTGLQAKLITLIIFIMRKVPINSNRFLCLIYSGTSHTHREERDCSKEKSGNVVKNQVHLGAHQAFFLWYLTHLMISGLGEGSY